MRFSGFFNGGSGLVDTVKTVLFRILPRGAQCQGGNQLIGHTRYSESAPMSHPTAVMVGRFQRGKAVNSTCCAAWIVTGPRSPEGKSGESAL